MDGNRKARATGREQNMGQLTNFDQVGRGRMVDVSSKEDSTRIAIASVASGEILMEAKTLQQIRQGCLHKGDVLAVADVAAIMGAKQTADWIPMCHRLMLSGVDVAFSELERERGGASGIFVRSGTDGKQGER